MPSRYVDRKDTRHHDATGLSRTPTRSLNFARSVMHRLMGAHLVTLVLTRWTHLNDRAFRLLVRMAHTALDKQHDDIPPNMYFGGRDLLAMTLRAERGGNPESLYRAVKRGIADLIEAGAIKRTSVARSGNNQVYLLTLNSSQGIDRDHEQGPIGGLAQGDTSGPPQGDTAGTPEGDTSGPLGVPLVSPLSVEEPLEELREEGSGDLRTAVTVTRAAEAAQNPNSIPPGNCPRHPAMRMVAAGRCAVCRAQAPIQSPLLGLITGGAA